MAAYTTVADWTSVEGDYVLSVTIRRTDDPAYPSGWSYSLHLGTVSGETILRYDNAHEGTKGHERHAAGSVQEIEFPGMLELYDRFRAEVREHGPTTWDWSAGQ